MRQNAFGHLKARKLEAFEICVLVIFAIIDACKVALNFRHQSGEWYFYLDVILAFSSLWLILSSDAYRFTNLRFSLLFFFLGMLYVALKFEPLSCVNILLFLYYHVLRLFFRKLYNKEFVPPEPNKSGFLAVYNSLENRKSNEDDNKYMRIMIWGGMGIFLICILLLSVKK